jgi:hypothetical protein
MKRSAPDSGSMPQLKKGPAVVVPVDVEPIPTSIQEMYQLFLTEKENSAKEMKKMKNKIHKVMISHSSDAKFLGAPHLLNIANEILHLFKGQTKPEPTKNTFVSFKGAMKKKFDALVTNLGVDGDEWAKKCDRINELRNAGIHCDSWQMVATRVTAALSFLKRHSYLCRSERDAVFIIKNYSKFKRYANS